MKPESLSLPDEARVINVGLPLFGEAVRAQGADAVDVDWRIPAGGHAELVRALEGLYGRWSERIDTANTEVLRRIDEARPQLTGIASMRDVVPGVGDRTILHCGPELEWGDFCDPLRRSVRAAVMAEGWAPNREAAETMVAAGDVQLEAANDHATALPMASAIGPSSPVFVVENPAGNNRAFSGINQGSGKVAWFGVDEPEAVERLVWLRDAAAPVLAAALRGNGPLDVFSLVSQGLQMGDEVHMRVQATTNLLLRQLLPHLVRVQSPDLPAVAEFLAGAYLSYLNLVMAAAKAVTDWASGVPHSSIVTGMSRNGTTFGIRVSGLGERWFICPAPRVGKALYNPGFSDETSAPDIGDSAVLELVGLGSAAAAASPAVAGFVGGTMADAIAVTLRMDTICAGRSTRFTLPYLDFRGTPIGVDLRRIVELDTTPTVNTGILHRSAGTGQVGAGVAEAPIECFREALLALDASMG
ncbi:MAG: DUF1116 domain-containing protein [Candidatus Dormiibacterota bacterium]|jgi:hypothetical protein